MVYRYHEGSLSNTGLPPFHHQRIQKLKISSVMKLISVKTKDLQKKTGPGKTESPSRACCLLCVLNHHSSICCCGASFSCNCNADAICAELCSALLCSALLCSALKSVGLFHMAVKSLSVSLPAFFLCEPQLLCLHNAAFPPIPGLISTIHNLCEYDIQFIIFFPSTIIHWQAGSLAPCYQAYSHHLLQHFLSLR